MKRLRFHIIVPVLLSIASLIGARSVSDPERGSSWWAYQPLERPMVPEVVHSAWVSNPIDNFILSKLEESGLDPAPPADRRTIIRRAYYDLTGLPPSPEEVDAFVNDDSPDAYENLIDGLLASPHYGEKWGRHWLDLVRFAETDSYERDRLKPSAWKFRDYVIDSFNDDKPFDQFILEQLAGDELEHPTVETMIATGYYRLGIWDDEPTDVKQAQYDDLDSILATTSQVFLGMTMNCARCHDHKGDPILQRDYYRMLAFFENISPYKEGGGNTTNPENYLRSLPVDLGSDEFEQVLRDYEIRREKLLRRVEDTKDRLIESRGNEIDERAMRNSDRGLILRLPLDDEPGLAASRLAQDERKFEIAGAPAFVEGKVATAFSFDGEDDFIRITRPVQNDFTITFWFRTTETGPGGADHRWFLGAGLVDGEVPGVVRDFGVSYHSEGRITAGTGEPETFVHSPPGYNDGKWHHVAFTRNQSTGGIALFIDGEEIARATGSTEPLDAPAFLTIGRMSPGERFFRGSIDDVHFFDRALDQREILDLAYGPGFSPDLAELVREALGEEEKRRLEQVIGEIVALTRPVRERTEILCVQEKGTEPDESFVRIRGNVHARGERVEPGFPSVLNQPDPVIPDAPAGAATSGRRRILAQWLVSEDNILTARVTANRLWHYHFGRGIVPTPNDFGRFGEPPSHPQLLDWLARELIERGWSIKSMHRLIMTSSAYRMSSRADDRALAIDPQNNLFWRFDMRRLSAEEIRDSILAVNGTLNREMGGPGVYPPMPREVLATSSRPEQAWGESSAAEAARRSIYIFVKRSLLTPLLETFDLADTDQSCPVRFATTQPTQALTMMNSEFLLDQSALFAERLRSEAGDDPKVRITRAFRLVASRSPEPEEIVEAMALIDSLKHEDGLSDDDAWKYFALIMLNLNEFLYLD